MSTMANTPEGAYHAKRAALVKHRALEADNARQRALIAELAGALRECREACLAMSDPEHCMFGRMPERGLIWSQLAARSGIILAKVREESA